MLQSLYTRLLLLVITVLLVSVALAVGLARSAMSQTFDQYFSEHKAAAIKRRQQLESILPQVLEAYYAQHLSWEAVGELVADFGELIEEGITLITPKGTFVIDSAYLRPGDKLNGLQNGYTIPIPINEQVTGEMRVRPGPLTLDFERERALLQQINRAQLFAVLAAALIAVLLSLTMARRILHPITALTDAARRMEQGDLKQRVEPGSTDEIRELASAFNAMADSLARGEQLRRNMVSDIAHELRTPLSNVLGYLEAVQDGVVEPTTSLVNSLHEEVMHLTHLVNDLQDLALAEAGNLKLQQILSPIGPLVTKTAQLVEHPMHGGQVELTIDVPDNLPPILMDVERIGQVLRNLVNNALTHTPSAGAIAISAHQQRTDVVVQVTNTGHGIDPEHLPYVFERFYRVDNSRTRTTGGCGLGLAIVRQLVEAHGGHVWATSSPGRTTTFAFRLPIAAT